MNKKIKININTKVKAGNITATETTDNKIICAACGGEMKLNGHDRKKQRYECKICGCTRIATEKTKEEAEIATYKYERKEKNILAALYAMLENDFWNDGGSDKALKEAFKKTNKYYKYIKNTKFDAEAVRENPNGSVGSLKCFQPKLLICVNDGKIRFIQIPPHRITDKSGNLLKRQFTIFDDKEYKI